MAYQRGPRNKRVGLAQVYAALAAALGHAQCDRACESPAVHLTARAAYAQLAAQAQIIKRVELELGGNSPFVVLEDADLQQAVEAAVVIGPIINQRQLEQLQKRITQARQEGARELLGGEARGLVLPPHVFSEVRNDMSVAREELFGPVAPVLRARNEEDALRIANETQQGLSSAVFTRDLERGVQFAQQIQAGMAHVNDQGKRIRGLGGSAASGR